MTSLRDLAEALSVSRSTVSRALNNDSRISRELRERVHAMADALGYKRDPVLSDRIRQRQRAESGMKWSIILPVPAGDLTYIFRYDELLAGARAYGGGLGYEFAKLIDDGTKPLAEQVAERDPGGLIIGCELTMFGVDDAFLGDYHVVLAIDYAARRPYHCCDGNHQAGIARVFDELVRRGYRRPALSVSRRTDRSSGFQWSQAYRFQCEQHGLTALPIIDWAGHIPKTLAPWLAEHRPDVVIARRSVRKALAACGVGIPADIGYCNLGVRSPGGETAGLLQNYADIGYNAMRILDSSIRQREMGRPSSPLTVLTGYQWVDGPSLRPPD